MKGYKRELSNYNGLNNEMFQGSFSQRILEKRISASKETQLGLLLKGDKVDNF